VLLEGGVLRAWNASGQAVADERDAVVLSAIGDRIRWNAETLLPSPIDVGSPGGLRASGKLLPGRIRITARAGMLLAVAVIPMEDYVAAVVSKEAPPRFEPEALSAVAVTVRTYALQAIEKAREPTHDVVSGVEDQVFEGVDNVAAVFRAAAESTRGVILTYMGAPARAVFHSTCGGRTETAKDAWGTDVPYLQSVVCDDCIDSPVRRWDYRISRKEGRRIALTLGVRADEDLRIEIVGRSSTGRASRIRLSSRGVSRETSAAAFRRSVGYARVRSLKMEIVPVGNGWTIVGQGYGHGVGMCQWGANGMAKAGKGYREILARYYPETRLAEIRS
jgi:stage II sporulation protein D